MTEKNPLWTGRETSKEKIDLVQIWPKMVEYVGFSEYESKIYLGLVNQGTTGARTLSLISDVPRTKVYGTLKKLTEYGIVMKIPGTPTLFTIKSPKENFNTMVKYSQEKTKDFNDIINNLENLFHKNKENGGPTSKTVWFLGPEDKIKEKCNEIMRTSNQLLCIYTTEDGLEVIFNSAHRLLDILYEKGVKIKIFSPLDPQSCPLARELSFISQVKKVEIKTPILLTISDNNSIFLGKLRPRGSQFPFESALFTDNEDLLELVFLLLKNNINFQSLLGPKMYF